MKLKAFLDGTCHKASQAKRRPRMLAGLSRRPLTDVKAATPYIHIT